jgi:NADH-quinone oxidoreductase subunit G
MHNPRQAVSALQQAELVVAMSPFQHHAVDYAHVMLPIAPFTETAGTFVNTEGRVQSFSGVVQPLGETRPAWKVLRVLGNLLGLDGFEQDSVADIRAELLQGQSEVANRSNALPQFNPVVIAQATVSSGYSRIAEVPIYAADQLVRRAVSLQKTRDAQVPRAHIHSQLAQQLGLNVGDRLRITQDGGETELEFAIDDQLPLSCVRLATACPETAQLGAESAPITLTRIAQQQVMGS